MENMYYDELKGKRCSEKLDSFVFQSDDIHNEYSKAVDKLYKEKQEKLKKLSEATGIELDKSLGRIYASYEACDDYFFISDRHREDACVSVPFKEARPLAEWLMSMLGGP